MMVTLREGDDEEMAEDSSSAGSIGLGRAVETFLASNGAGGVAVRAELARFVVLCGKECPIFTIAGTEIAEFISEVKKPAERRRRVEALVAFFDYAKACGWVRSNPAAGLVQKKESPIRKTAPKVQHKPVELSAEGRRAIESEIQRLAEERARTIEEVREARSDGDLSENAPYHAAREKLAMIEAQIREYQDMLLRAVSRE